MGEYHGKLPEIDLDFFKHITTVIVLTRSRMLSKWVGKRDRYLLTK
jgi:hypothetical protein